jgi:GNAT superfamily N-acetyltransferase
MIVRRATDADYEQLDALAKKFFVEGQMKGEIGEDTFSTGLRKYVDMDVATCFTLVDGSVVKGMIGGMVTIDFVTQDLVCTEMFWYVDPDHRRQGIKLHRALEIEAKNRGCARIYMVHLAKLNANKMEKYYLRCGYEPQEVFYTKPLK